ncbi:hypothetical protein HPB51_020510 [Rhipicephalus microplus]|uniref:Uncharacterized protein n=1 Tax=Rhipicephalus microplus TaxID=6941 RepID=A0A9J6EUF5_RHIMP|nr:hypothetical protein HPB51_020510 [Rhipicephalus microplus]
MPKATTTKATTTMTVSTTTRSKTTTTSTIRKTTADPVMITTLEITTATPKRNPTTKASTTTPKSTATSSQTTTTRCTTTMPAATTMPKANTTKATTTMPVSTTTRSKTTTTSHTATSSKTTKTLETTTQTTTTVKMTTTVKSNSTASLTIRTTTQKTTTPVDIKTKSTSEPFHIVNLQPLLCTIGSGNFTTQMFPHDGLCDYIFYDSIYKRGIKTFHTPDMLFFIEKRREYSRTTFGIGFTYEHTAHVSSMISQSKNPDSPFILGFFWKERIYHFGVLDTPTVGVRDTPWKGSKAANVKNALDLLRIISDFSDYQRLRGRLCLMVLAAGVPNDAWAEFYAARFSPLWPFIFISVGHYDKGDNTFTDCHVMPPTVLSRPAEVAAENSSYEYDLTSAAAGFDRLVIAGDSSIRATSVTMKGRWTVLEEGEQAQFLATCVHDPSAESFGEVAKAWNLYSTAYIKRQDFETIPFLQVCEDPSFEPMSRNSQLYGTLTYNISHVFAFDDEAAFQQKTSAAAGFDRLVIAGDSSIRATSVTMKGRWTVLEEGERAQFLATCVHDPSAESFGEVAKAWNLYSAAYIKRQDFETIPFLQVCEDPSFEPMSRNSQLYGTLTYNTSHVFAFDDEAAFQQKLCRLKADRSSQYFGIAVFDLEYEDFSNACDPANSHGAFARLKALRRIIDFFKTNFKKPSDRAACLNLTR